LLTQSAITREDYARDPQAVLEVLEFYTDQQRKGNVAGDDFGAILPNNMRPSGSSSLPSQAPAPAALGRYGDPSYAAGGAARFAGTGLGGAGGLTPSKSNPALNQAARLQPPRQDSFDSSRENGRATPQMPSASRPAPPRPVPSATRAPPPAPNITPSPADLRARTKAQGPGGATEIIRPSVDRDVPSWEDSLNEPVRPTIQTAKSSSPTVPSPQSVKPLAPPKKTPSRSTTPLPAGGETEREREEREIQEQRDREREQRERERERERDRERERQRERELEKEKERQQREKEKERERVKKEEENKNTGVAAAAAALEKPKVTAAERRISTLTEAQIMDKLRSVVSQDDPKTLYSTIKKIGQG